MSQSVVVDRYGAFSHAGRDFDKRIRFSQRNEGKSQPLQGAQDVQTASLWQEAIHFSFGEFELFEGKSAYSLSKVTISNYFRELTQDLEAVYTGFYFLEFCGYFCQENNDEKDMLKLLYQSLRALESPAYKNELVRAVF